MMDKFKDEIKNIHWVDLGVDEHDKETISKLLKYQSFIFNILDNYKPFLLNYDKTSREKVERLAKTLIQKVDDDQFKLPFNYSYAYSNELSFAIFDILKELDNRKAMWNELITKIENKTNKLIIANELLGDPNLDTKEASILRKDRLYKIFAYQEFLEDLKGIK